MENKSKEDGDKVLSGRERQLQALAEHSQQKSRHTEEVVLKALVKMIKAYRNGKIKKLTVSAVAKEAGITNATIYNNKALLERIRQTASLQVGLENCNESPKNKKENRIRKLILHNDELKKINVLLLGNLEKKTVENLELRAKISTLENFGITKSLREN